MLSGRPAVGCGGLAAGIGDRAGPGFSQHRGWADERCPSRLCARVLSPEPATPAPGAAAAAGAVQPPGAEVPGAAPFAARFAGEG